MRFNERVRPVLDHLYYQENFFDGQVPPWRTGMLEGWELRKGGRLRIPLRLSEGRIEWSEWLLESGDDRVLTGSPEDWMPWEFLKSGLVRRTWRTPGGASAPEVMATLRVRIPMGGEDSISFRLFV